MPPALSHGNHCAQVIGQMFGAWPTSTWQSDLADGLVANSSGIVAYLLFRGARMRVVWKQRCTVGIARCNTANPFNTYGRQKPILELEILLLRATPIQVH